MPIEYVGRGDLSRVFPLLRGTRVGVGTRGPKPGPSVRAHRGRARESQCPTLTGSESLTMRAVAERLGVRAMLL